MRIIKKYSNRRLYDTEESRYITLSEIKNYVVESIDFEIKDAKTNKDLTNDVLLQIILEEEGFNKPIFTTAILKNIIRFYGNPSQRVMSQYLEQVMQSFSDSKTTDPLSAMTKMTAQNIQFWQDALKNISPSNSQPAEKKEK